MLRPRETSRTEDIPVESASEKKIRYFLAVMFFIQTFMTTSPFMHEIIVNEDGTETLRSITALQFIVQSDGIMANSISLAMLGLPLIVLPITAFFFCIFDKRSKIKYIATGLCSVVCAALIVFGIGRDTLSLGAVITLVINVVTLFMTTQGVQATSIRRASQLKKR